MCTGEVLRTLQISGRSDLSGGPILMTRLLQGLSEHGFEHLVVCPDRPEGVNVILAKTSNVRLLNLPLREICLRNYTTLLKVAKQFRPNLIHSHGKAAGLYGRALGKCLGIPVVHHYHGGSCRQIGEAGVVLVYYDPFELTTFQQEYGDDPVSHQSFAE